MQRDAYFLGRCDGQPATQRKSRAERSLVLSNGFGASTVVYRGCASLLVFPFSSRNSRGLCCFRPSAAFPVGRVFSFCLDFLGLLFFSGYQRACLFSSFYASVCRATLWWCEEGLGFFILSVWDNFLFLRQCGFRYAKLCYAISNLCITI